MPSRIQCSGIAAAQEEKKIKEEGLPWRQKLAKLYIHLKKLFRSDVCVDGKVRSSNTKEMNKNEDESA